MRLSIDDWKPFVTSRLFEKFVVGKANQQLLNEGNECFYVGAKKDDNGVMLHCLRDESLMMKGNCIVFICNGQGSVGFANYMDVDFIGTTDIVAGYSKYLNEYIGIFLATLYSQERPKYSFGRKWKTHLKDTTINLPIVKDTFGDPIVDISRKWSDDGFMPDWQFMEKCIKSLHHKPLTTKNINTNNLNLQLSSMGAWKYFKISTIFDRIEFGKVSQANELQEGDDIWYLGAKKDNNGLMMKCKFEEDLVSKGNCVVFICDGQGSVGYANYMDCDFLGTVNLALGYSKNLNKYVGLFISTIASLERPKYSYGRKWKPTLRETLLKLPSLKVDDKQYVPDWQFMEEYIKSLPYGDRI